LRRQRTGECLKHGRVRERESEERWRALEVEERWITFVEEERERERERATKAATERCLGFEEAEKWRVRKRT